MIILPRARSSAVARAEFAWRIARSPRVSACSSFGFVFCWAIRFPDCNCSSVCGGSSALRWQKCTPLVLRLLFLGLKIVPLVGTATTANPSGIQSRRLQFLSLGRDSTTGSGICRPQCWRAPARAQNPRATASPPASTPNNTTETATTESKRGRNERASIASEGTLMGGRVISSAPAGPTPIPSESIA